MIYDYMNLNPFLLVFVICPLLSFIFGAAFAFLGLGRSAAPITAFLLPLLYTTIDLRTFKANVDAWLLWGSVYAFIAFIAGWAVTRLIKGSKGMRE